MLALLKVGILGGVVGVAAGVGGCAILPAAVDHSGHIGGQVSALTAGTADHNQSGVGECLGVGHHLIGVGGSRRLGQSPVLSAHGNGGTVCTVSGVEIAQLGVQGEAGVLQAFQQGDGVVGVVQSAGTGAAVNGIGGSPAKHVQVAGGQGQGAALVLQQNDALVRDVLNQISSFGAGLLTDGAAAGGQIDHGVHGAKADQVNSNYQGQQDGQTGLATDHVFLCLRQFHAGDHGNDRQHQNETKANQLRLHGIENFDDVFNIDRQHFVSSLKM